MFDFNRTVKNFDGTDIEDKESKKKLDFKTVCVNSLLAAHPNESPDGTEKLRRYDLAMQIYKDEKEDLSAEEIVLLKELISKVFTTLVVGQVFKALDG